AATLQAGRHRRLRAGLHPLARGLRDAGPAGRGAVHDDRQPDPAPVPRGPRLAVRLGAVVRANGRGARGGAVLPPGGQGEEPVMKTRSWLVAPSVADLLFLYLPIAILIVFSFNASKLSARWQGFSLEWYATLFTDLALLAATVNSLIVATVSTVLAGVLGVLTAVALERQPVRWQGGFGGLLPMPIVRPGHMMAVAIC